MPSDSLEIAQKYFPDDLKRASALASDIETLISENIKRVKNKKPLLSPLSEEYHPRPQSEEAERVNTIIRQRRFVKSRSEVYNSWAPAIYGVEYTWMAIVRALHDLLHSRSNWLHPKIWMMMQNIWVIKFYSIATSKQNFTPFEVVDFYHQYIFRIRAVKGLYKNFSNFSYPQWKMLVDKGFLVCLPHGEYSLSTRSMLLLSEYERHLKTHLRFPQDKKTFVRRAATADVWYIEKNTPRVKPKVGGKPRKEGG